MIIVDKILLIVLLVFVLIAAIKDAKTRKIPNYISLTLFFIWILSIFVKFTLIGTHIIDFPQIDVWKNCAMQVLTSALICCVLAACIVFVNNRRKKRNQLEVAPFGMGDIKLLMVICLYLSPFDSFLCVVFACVSFVLYMILISIVKKESINSGAFAPFIFIGVMLIVCGQVIFGI